MSYPYLSDLINYFFGTQWSIPIAMFGTFVAMAIVVATIVGKKEIIRFENANLLPAQFFSSKGFIPTHQIITDLAMVSALSGIVGARLFHIFEYPAEFLEDPVSMIFSRQGLSIYGGLIVGVVAGIVFLKKRNIPVVPMLDALAPSIVLGYGIGRLGCQVSGDGDWGIASNMALKPDWLPTWFWAQTYENNIAGVTILSPGVYPTPLYEAATAFCIFLFLWAIRKNKFSSGFMFSTYLLLSGFGRLLIEKIRINSQYHVAEISFTQAEFISTLLILLGLVGILKTTQFKNISKIALSLIVVGALTACSKL